MRNFVTKSVPGLLAVILVAGVGYFVLTPPSMPAVQASAIEIAAHNVECAVCRLPLYGHDNVSSRLGHDTQAHENAQNATH
jgi:hypothetical protein